MHVCQIIFWDSTKLNWWQLVAALSQHSIWNNSNSFSPFLSLSLSSRSQSNWWHKYDSKGEIKCGIADSFESHWFCWTVLNVFNYRWRTKRSFYFHWAIHQLFNTIYCYRTKIIKLKTIMHNNFDVEFISLFRLVVNLALISNILGSIIRR